VNTALLSLGIFFAVVVIALAVIASKQIKESKREEGVFHILVQNDTSQPVQKLAEAIAIESSKASTDGKEIVGIHVDRVNSDTKRVYFRWKAKNASPSRDYEALEFAAEQVQLRHVFDCDSTRLGPCSCGQEEKWHMWLKLLERNGVDSVRASHTKTP